MKRNVGQLMKNFDVLKNMADELNENVATWQINSSY